VRKTFGRPRASGLQWAGGAMEWVRSDALDCEYRVVAPRHAWFLIFDETVEGEERSVNGVAERQSGLVRKRGLASFVPAGAELRGSARRIRSNYLALFVDPTSEVCETLRPDCLELASRVAMDPTLNGLGQLLARESLSPEPDADLGERMADAVLAAWSRLTTGPAPAPFRRPDLIHRIRETIEDDLCGDLSAAGLARVVGLSRFHLQRLFRADTGQTLGAYVTALRLARARHLLAATRLDITEIALECGFASGQHFATVFRREQGVTPSAYRAMAPRQ
jgi:AraC family transcriptional regulator